VDPRGFTFFTDYRSQKGRDLLAHPGAALVFFWPELERQVRIRGTVDQLAPDESAAYYDSRPRGSRIGAWASKQSKPLRGAELERNVAAIMLRHPRGRVPRPPHWSGFRVVAERIELWSEKPFRMHDRELFSRTAPDVPWTRQMLQP